MASQQSLSSQKPGAAMPPSSNLDSAEAPAPPRHTGWVIAIVVAGGALLAGAAGLAWWLLG